MTAIISDPAGERYGFPTYPRGLAPRHLMTRRMLAAAGLRKNNQDPVAQLLFYNRGRLVTAYLYDSTLAAPRRPWTSAKQHAVEKAAASRRFCGTCRATLDYIPRYGECNPCTDSRNTLGRPLEHAAWKTTKTLNSPGSWRVAPQRRSAEGKSPMP